MRKFVLQLIIVVVSLIVVVNVCYLFLTWLSHRVFHIENVYLQSEYRLLGTLVITLGILIFIFASIYRRRKKEVVTLADHIERVLQETLPPEFNMMRKNPWLIFTGILTRWWKNWTAYRC